MRVSDPFRALIVINFNAEQFNMKVADIEEGYETLGLWNLSTVRNSK
jgi:hypothetical protein